MRALCTDNKGHSLSAKHFEIGYTSSSSFDLEIGKEYVVYAVSLWKGILNYLVVGEGLFPHWYPLELFRLTQNKMPPCWYFACFSEEQGFEIGAIWGYKELVNTETHFDDLANLDKGALDIFVQRKKQIDEVS